MHELFGIQVRRVDVNKHQLPDVVDKSFGIVQVVIGQIEQFVEERIDEINGGDRVHVIIQRHHNRPFRGNYN